MKNKSVVIIASFLAVLICLIISTLLFFAVTPAFLIMLSFVIGTITGVCITALIMYMVNNIRNRRSEKE
jgi:FtsH-binding integral membrane protein